MDLIVSPIVTVYELLAIAMSLMALTFIALILLLDRTPKPEPIALPKKKQFFR